MLAPKQHQNSTETAPNNFGASTKAAPNNSLLAPKQHQKRKGFFGVNFGALLGTKKERRFGAHFGAYEKRVLRLFGVLCWC